MNNAVAELEETFRGCGYAFRCFPGARCECLTFQAGRIETTRVVIPAEIATGNRAVELYTECFRLVAFASGEQSGLLTRIAATESVSLCVRMKS